MYSTTLWENGYVYVVAFTPNAFIIQRFNCYNMAKIPPGEMLYVSFPLLWVMLLWTLAIIKIGSVKLLLSLQNRKHLLINWWKIHIKLCILLLYNILLHGENDDPSSQTTQRKTVWLTMDKNFYSECCQETFYTLLIHCAPFSEVILCPGHTVSFFRDSLTWLGRVQCQILSPKRYTKRRVTGYLLKLKPILAKLDDSPWVKALGLSNLRYIVDL